MQHKWYNEIVAWANGAEIEVRFDGGKWLQNLKLCWDWDNAEYRIKPQPKELQYLYAYFDYKELAVKWSITGGNIGQGDYIGKIKLEDE